MAFKLLKIYVNYEEVRMNKKGFTLIELLIVVAIIGIVAAIAIPNLLTALQKGKQKATMGDMKSIGTAVESYMTDISLAPATIPSGAVYLVPFHIKKMPLGDGWGNNWFYARDATQLDIYSIGSAGRDGAMGAWSQVGTYIVDSLTDFNNDIIFSNGTFVWGPQTK